MICSCRMSLRTASTEVNWLAAPMVMTGASPPPVVVCSCLLQQSNKVASVFLFGSSEKKGHVRNRMGSGNRMGSVQQVTINSYRHMFLLVCVYIYIYICNVYYTLPFETSATALCGTTGRYT